MDSEEQKVERSLKRERQMSNQAKDFLLTKAHVEAADLLKTIEECNLPVEIRVAIMNNIAFNFTTFSRCIAFSSCSARNELHPLTTAIMDADTLKDIRSNYESMMSSITDSFKDEDDNNNEESKSDEKAPVLSQSHTPEDNSDTDVNQEEPVLELDSKMEKMDIKGDEEAMGEFQTSPPQEQNKIDLCTPADNQDHQEKEHTEHIEKTEENLPSIVDIGYDGVPRY